MERLISTILLGVLITCCYWIQSSAALPTTTTTTTGATNASVKSEPTGPQLSDNYLPPVMQAVAYYVELLQYEPVGSTTIEPPFEGISAEGGTTYPTTSIKPTTEKPWWQTMPTTSKPPSSSTIWWVPPPTTTKKPATTTSTTKKPTTTAWWQSSTTKKPLTTDEKETTATVWWSTKPSKVPSTVATTKQPTTPWWQTTVTVRDDKKTTVPWWQTLPTTQKSSTVWWKPPPTTTTKPMVWWPTPSTSKKPAITAIKPTVSMDGGTTVWRPTSTKRPTILSSSSSPKPTPLHNPGYFAPVPYYSRPSSQAPLILDNHIEKTSPSPPQSPPSSTEREREEIILGTLDSQNNFFDWLFQDKAKEVKPDIEYDLGRLDPLPAGLLKDIHSETSHLPAFLDKDNVIEFLKVYSDFNRSYKPISGKKRVPPTKPYVELLMLYDLLKREAKTNGLNKYEGYSDKMILELAETSKRSAERQLHILFTRLLARGDVMRSDVISRIKSIITDLENPYSVTAKSLRVLPALTFLP